MRPAGLPDVATPTFRRLVPIAALLTALVLAIPGAASAAAAPVPQEADAGLDELEQLMAVPVYAASKYKQSAAEAPAAPTVLTQGDIRSFGWRTLGEVLNGVRGVFLRYDRAYTYAGVRGLSRPGDYSSRLLVLIDGMRANENIYDSVLIGREFPLDVGLIERVEFIPGPGSAMYGSNAVLGVINVVTRSAASLRGGAVAVTLDSDRGRKLQLSLAREFDTGALLVAGSAESRPGGDLYLPEFDSPDTGFGRAVGLDGERDRKLMARWTGGAWTLTALAAERRKQIPNASFDLVFGESAVWTDRMTLVGGTWQSIDAAGEGWHAQAGLGQYDYHDIGRYEPDRLLTAYRNQGRWLQGELRRTLRLGGAHLVLAGVDVQRNFRQAISNTVLEPEVSDSGSLSTGTRLGLFVNDEIALNPGLRLGLGVRLDRESSGSWHSTPRLSLLWQAAPGLVAKLLAGTAYREPNVYERAPEADGRPWNEALRREQVDSREVVIDWRATERLRVSASWFRNRVTDMIEQVDNAETGLLIYRNVGAATSRGVEAEAEYLAAAGWRLRGSWTGQRVTGEGGQAVSNSPRWLAKLHGTAPVAGWPLRLGLELQGLGPRLTLAGATLPAHWLANATVLWDPPGRAWSLAASLYNLGNRRTADPSGPEFVGDRIEQDGRSLALRWGLAF
ncbi:TonB-dependent siderophore receptor [Ideonella sp. A 288]|uniref:TonB-dependent receptor plug domain-containing protein n=1 Tax=Ideonella sp. A 288 TaxID=1962181 RepID=UPI000B4B4444|nr:TonB-dependent receptor [Ideonella sp. A 288]